MQGDKVKLHNRYGDEVYLEKIDEGKYKLVHHSSFTRYGLIEGKTGQYSFIDISGGPMISVGDTIEVGKVKSIYCANEDNIIEVET